MKKIILNILKEIGIAIGILVILAAVVVVTFKDQLPYDEEIRQGDEYVQANLKEYSVSSSDRLLDVKAITITHEADSSQIVEAENEVRVQTGKYTPFGNIDGNSDLPTETVGVNIGAEDNSSTSTSGTTNSVDDLDYPSTDDPIKQIEKEQSESSESAADRRFNTAD